MLRAQHGFYLQRPIPFFFSSRPLRSRSLSYKHGHRVPAGNDGCYKFMTRPVRRGEHDSSSLGKGIVEYADRSIEFDLIHDGCGCKSAVKGCQRSGEKPAYVLKITAFGSKGHSGTQSQAHLLANPPT